MLQPLQNQNPADLTSQIRFSRKPSAPVQVQTTQTPVFGHSPVMAAQPAIPASNDPGLWQVYRNVTQPKFGNYQPLGYDVGDILLGDPALGSKELKKWSQWKDIIWDEATKPREGFEDGPNRGEGKGWLNPEDTIFVVADRVKLLQAAARSGYLSRFPHWSHGEAFQELYNHQKYGFSKIYELVSGGNPCYAFLLDENPTHSQKLVMAHVYGHTDFEKNNIMFSKARGDIAHLMGDTARYVERIKADPLLMRKAKQDGYHPVTRFLDNFLAVQYLVDFNQLEPPRITPYGQRSDKKLDEVPDVGPDTKKLGVGSWMKDFILGDDEQEQYEDQMIEERERRTKDIPAFPTADVLGFVVEHSKTLEPWQRELLTRLREESYYFSGLIQTKVMNEGWASFWHNKLLNQESIMEKKDISANARMIAGVESPSPQGLNPYWMGVNVFRDIYNRASRHIPLDAKSEDYGTDEWTKMWHREPDDVAGIKAVQEVRRHKKDLGFISDHLTQEFIDEHEMYIYDGFSDHDWQTGQDIRRKVIVSRDPSRVKANILKDYFNGGMPRIEVVNGNFGGNGQLLLKHDYTGKDINRADAVKTIKILQQLWGQPVHLDTMYTLDVDRQQLDYVLRQLYWARQREKQGWANGWGGNSKELEQKYFDLIEGVRKVPIRISTTDETDKKGYKKVKIWVLDANGNVKTRRNPRTGREEPMEFNPRDFQPKMDHFDDDDWF